MGALQFSIPIRLVQLNDGIGGGVRSIPFESIEMAL